MLEYHADFLAIHVDIALWISDRFSLKKDFPARRHFQKIQGTQKSGLSGTGWTDDSHYLSLTDRRVNMI